MLYVQWMYIVSMTPISGGLASAVRVTTRISNGSKRITITAGPGFTDEDWKLALATAGISDDYDDWDYFEPDGTDLMVWAFTVPAET